MDKIEFTQIAMLIKTLYPNNKELFSSSIQIDIWYPALSDLDYSKAVKAVYEYAKKNSYAPTVADIRNYAMKRQYDGDEIQEQLLAQFRDDPPQLRKMQQPPQIEGRYAI